MSWAFSTGWGLLYLVVLGTLMLPAALIASKRYLAGAMFMLWICDRAAVNMLPPEMALYFLAFAYTLVAGAVVVTHAGRGTKIVAGALLVTSFAFILGGFKILDWDIAGSIQEASGLVAMLAIIGGRFNGTGRFHKHYDGGSRQREFDHAGAHHARKEHRH